jgi:hypothetical protein
MNKLEVLRRSEEQLQKLCSNDKKCKELVQKLANIAMQLMVQNEALKEVLSTLQMQKEQSKKSMSFVDEESNKVDMHRVLLELDNLQ